MFVTLSSAEEYRFIYRKWGMTMLVDYTWVGTDGQTLDRQVDQLLEAGVDMRRIFREKASGTIRKRLKLSRMLSELSPGDVVVITDLTCLSRSTKALLEIVDEVKEKGTNLKEPEGDGHKPHYCQQDTEKPNIQ